MALPNKYYVAVTIHQRPSRAIPVLGRLYRERLTWWYEFANGRLSSFVPGSDFISQNNHIFASGVLADHTFGPLSIFTIPVDPTSTMAAESRFFWNDLHIKIEGGRCNLDWVLEDGDRRPRIDPSRSTWLRILQGTSHVDDTPGNGAGGLPLDASGNLALFWGLVALSVDQNQYSALPELVNTRRWTRPVSELGAELQERFVVAKIYPDFAPGNPDVRAESVNHAVNWEFPTSRIPAAQVSYS